MKNLKLISTILLSLMLIFSISSAVFADNEEDNLWGTPNIVENNTTSELDSNNSTGLSSENSLLTNEMNIEDESNNEYNNLYTTTNSTTLNSTTTNSNSLANTGIGDSNGIIALIIIVSIIIAIYSAKKFNEYKNL